MDTRPGFDDTGILVGLLVVAAAAVVALDGSCVLGRALVLGALVGGPTPVLELANGGLGASVVAIAITVAAALGTASVLRALRTSAPTGRS